MTRTYLISLGILLQTLFTCHGAPGRKIAAGAGINRCGRLSFNRDSGQLLKGIDGRTVGDEGFGVWVLRIVDNLIRRTVLYHFS